MPIILRLNGIRIKVFWLAALFLLTVVFVLAVCVPIYRRTIIAYVRAYLRPNFLAGGEYSGIQEYDIYRPIDDVHSVECLRLPFIPDPWVCIHDPMVDRFISGYIKDGDMWELEATELFYDLLEQHPDLGVVDIGANIGQYSLLGAWLGRPVVAVEASLAHVQMLHHAVVLNGFQSHIRLMHNAISDTRGVTSLQFSRDNQGATRVINARPPCSSLQCNVPSRNSAYHVMAIKMDDLLEVVHFHKVLLKIHIEGDEAKAILNGIKFLQSLFVPYVLIEWEMMRKSHTEGEDVVDMLHTLGYQAFTVNKELLQNENFTTWPNDVVWKHQTAEF